MLFNSISFFIFFPVVTALYFALPHRLRWLHLLLASCVFYMFFIPAYILILFFTIIIDYFAGIWIENEPDMAKRKRLLSLSIVANVGVLAVFKYYNFFVDNVNTFLHQIGIETTTIPLLGIILPIGLSFHTFQAMSYTIEVYRGTQKAERHFGIYALYVMFYPQLVAGPIERPQNVLHQFYERHAFDWDRMVSGLRLMLWGMFKKAVIADRIAVLVNNGYSHAEEQSGLALLLATLLFTVQIYCDFSGYSDIALGSARVMGFKLMRNFDMPYFSGSVTEFWRRWHISLSTWFRDYLYIPLGGNRVSKPRQYFNRFFVFLTSGLWHGANWTFVVWGGLHGLALTYEAATKPLRERVFGKLPRFIAVPFAMACTTGFAALCWIFFRAKSMKEAMYVLGAIVGRSGAHPYMAIRSEDGTILGRPVYYLALSFALIGVLFGLEWLHRQHNLVQVFVNRPRWQRWSIYYALLSSVLFLGVFDLQGFIYFQF